MFFVQQDSFSFCFVFFFNVSTTIPTTFFPTPGPPQLRTLIPINGHNATSKSVDSPHDFVIPEDQQARCGNPITKTLMVSYSVFDV